MNVPGFPVLLGNLFNSPGEVGTTASLLVAVAGGGSAGLLCARCA